MKNIKQLFRLFILATLLASCEGDGGTSNLDLRKGAVPDFQKDPSLEAIINLNDLMAGDELSIGFSLDLAYGDVRSADVVAFYSSGEDIYGPVTLETGITDFPLEMSFTIEDIIAAFPELESREDIQLADELIISADLVLDDGTELSLLKEDGSRNYGSDIHTSPFFNAQLIYPVSCPSELAGTYNVVSNGTNTDVAPPAVDYPYTVTITDEGGGTYTISDGVAGLYILWYSVYGYSFETPGTFTDVCGTLTGSWDTQFTGDSVSLTGTVNGDGTLSIQWTNAFGDQATAIYTPQ